MLVTAICLALSIVGARAQRWTPGRPSLDALLVFGEGKDFTGVGINGAVVTWNNYQYLGKTSLGVDFYSHPYVFVLPEVTDKEGKVVAPQEDLVFRGYDVTLGGGYFVRALATRSRSLMLSVGVSLYAGIRYGDDVSAYEKEQGKNYSAVGFLLNIIPEAQLEAFPASNVSLFLSARPRLQVVNTHAGAYDWFRFTWGLGAKYYF